MKSDGGIATDTLCQECPPQASPGVDSDDGGSNIKLSIVEALKAATDTLCQEQLPLSPLTVMM